MEIKATSRVSLLLKQTQCLNVVYEAKLPTRPKIITSLAEKFGIIAGLFGKR